MKLLTLSPSRWLLAGAFGCVIAALLTVFTATRGPWLGLVLAAPDAPETKVTIISATGPSAGILPGSSLVSVGAPREAPVPLQPTDLIDEPDYFDRYADMDAFFERQTELFRILRGDRVVLTLEREGVTQSLVVHPAPVRPLSSLPTAFWFQLGAGCVGFLVSLWVLVLRPGVTAVHMFALAGAMILGFSAPAAIYSTRELALDGALFRVLSGMNHLCANLFGIGLVGIFVMFPMPLVRPRVLWILPAVFVSWVVLDVTRLAPNQSWGSRAPIMLEMLLAIVFALVQWRCAKNDARAQASLRWFGVCVLTGASAFVFSVVGTRLFGMFPPIPQGYSFGFFLLMHVGLALGLRQTRLFELNELAYTVLFWVVGAIALVAIDAAVLLLLDTSQLVSSAVALFVVGLAYVPVRSWVWSKAISRKKLDEYALFRRLLDVVFALDSEVRLRRWIELFEAMFSPLEIDPVPAGLGEIASVAVQDDGLRMVVPSVTTLPALRLAFPWRGRGLFGDRHAKLVTALLQLAEHVENARDAFDRGVREERSRVARDLHDDLGAALTSALYESDRDRIHQAVRLALREMRAMVNQLNGTRVRIADVVGELRHEALERLAPTPVKLVWPLVDLGTATVHSSIARNYGSMVRELTSNIVRHSQARVMTVDVACEPDGHFVTTITDDGVGFDPDAPTDGNGLRNLRRRARDVGGTIEIVRRDRGTSVRVRMPLDRMTPYPRDGQRSTPPSDRLSHPSRPTPS